MLLGGKDAMVLSVVLFCLPRDRDKESVMSFFLFGSSSGRKITGNYNVNTKCSRQIICPHNGLFTLGESDDEIVL